MKKSTFRLLIWRFVILFIVFDGVSYVTAYGQSIVLEAKSGSQKSQSAITVKKGDMFTISGNPKGLKGLVYGESGFTAAWFFGPILEGSCSINEADPTKTWIFDCIANNVGETVVSVEITKNGKGYRSNLIKVTVSEQTGKPYSNNICKSSVFSDVCFKEGSTIKVGSPCKGITGWDGVKHGPIGEGHCQKNPEQQWRRFGSCYCQSKDGKKPTISDLPQKQFSIPDVLIDYIGVNHPTHKDPAVALEYCNQHIKTNYITQPIHIAMANDMCKKKNKTATFFKFFNQRCANSKDPKLKGGTIYADIECWYPSDPREIYGE